MHRTSLTVTLFALLALSACAAPVSSDDTSSAADTAAAHAAPHNTASGSSTLERPTIEVFHASSDTNRLALVHTWQKRNGAAWDISSFSLGPGLYDVDGFRGYVKAIWRSDALGPKKAVSMDNAISMAQDFVKKNADLLGLSRADLDALSSVNPSIAPPSGGPYAGYQYLVHFEQTLPLPGYETFTSVASQTSIDIGIHSDGEIRAVLQNGDHNPQLRVSTTPALSAQEPGVLANVVGTELAHYKAIGSKGYQIVYKKTDLGRAEASNATAVDLTIFVKDADDLSTRTFRLAYAVTLSKGGDDFSFTVDAMTGEVLDAPQPPIGVIQ